MHMTYISVVQTLLLAHNAANRDGLVSLLSVGNVGYGVSKELYYSGKPAFYPLIRVFPLPCYIKARVRPK